MKNHRYINSSNCKNNGDINPERRSELVPIEFVII